MKHLKAFLLLAGLSVALLVTACGLPSQASPTGVASPTVAKRELSIQLIGVETTNERLLVGFQNGDPQYIAPSADHVILMVKLDFYLDGRILTGSELGDRPKQVSVVDSAGQTFTPDPTFTVDMDADGTTHAVQLFFDVPTGSSGFKLLYQGASAFSLGR
jgi:hypothetical protein